jgi:hypothetical protein
MENWRSSAGVDFIPERTKINRTLSLPTISPLPSPSRDETGGGAPTRRPEPCRHGWLARRRARASLRAAPSSSPDRLARMAVGAHCGFSGDFFPPSPLRPCRPAPPAHLRRSARPRCLRRCYEEEIKLDGSRRSAGLSPLAGPQPP